jgi:hypothetical protein
MSSVGNVWCLKLRSQVKALLQTSIICPRFQGPHLVLLWTQSAIPLMDKIIPIIVSNAPLAHCPMADCGFHLRRLITFFSTHHSPITVNKNASVLVMGTVKLNSVTAHQPFMLTLSQ